MEVGHQKGRRRRNVLHLADRRLPRLRSAVEGLAAGALRRPETHVRLGRLHARTVRPGAGRLERLLRFGLRPLRRLQGADPPASLASALAEGVLRRRRGGVGAVRRVLPRFVRQRRLRLGVFVALGLQIRRRRVQGLAQPGVLDAEAVDLGALAPWIVALRPPAIFREPVGRDTTPENAVLVEQGRHARGLPAQHEEFVRGGVVRCARHGLDMSAVLRTVKSAAHLDLRIFRVRPSPHLHGYKKVALF